MPGIHSIRLPRLGIGRLLIAGDDVLDLVGCRVVAVRRAGREPHIRDAKLVGIFDLLAKFGRSGRDVRGDAAGAQRVRDEIRGGAILLNGYDVKQFSRSALREGFGMVLQDTWLFKGTIMENIRYGRLDATDEEVIAAAKAANADHFIRTLPGGYQMELNEDASNVSQCQKQLLTIARTILADNRILILDEATSSVDTRTEQRIQTAMDRLMEGRTSFVIAHRLSTIRDADLILVMRDGDIVEQGTHDQLIEAGGFYADLYNSQFEDVVD